MPRFVIQEHYATSHHFDLRLERDGVLVSWAVPKGMPESTKKNRLAMRVDDHHLSHLDVVDEAPVEGVPGAVRKSIWDRGTYEVEEFGDEMVIVRLRGRLAQQRVPGGLTGVIVAATPIFVALYALRLDRTERFGRRRVVGLAVGLMGVALVVGLGAVSTMGQFLSALVILLAAALFAAAGCVTKSYYEGVPSITRAFFALLITSGLIVIPAGATIPAGAPGASALVGILLLGLGSTACGLYAYFTLVDEVGAGRAALVTYLGPGFSLLMGALLLGERITPASVVGLALILGGGVIASRGNRPADIPAAVPCCEGLATGHPLDNSIQNRPPVRRAKPSGEA